MMSRAEGACRGAAAGGRVPVRPAEGGGASDGRGRVSPAGDGPSGWATRGARARSDTPAYNATATAAIPAPHVTKVRRRSVARGGAMSAGVRPASALTKSVTVVNRSADCFASARSIAARALGGSSGRNRASGGGG